MQVNVLAPDAVSLMVPYHLSNQFMVITVLIISCLLCVCLIQFFKPTSLAGLVMIRRHLWGLYSMRVGPVVY